jgi:hypothetical protein
MSIHPLLLLSAAALILSTSASRAGPCSQEIDRVQAAVDAKIEAIARLGRSARETTGARLHHQPTPGSIAAVESSLGELSAQTVEAVTAAMARARKADRAEDKSACAQALADVQRAIGP